MPEPLHAGLRRVVQAHMRGVFNDKQELYGWPSYAYTLDSVSTGLRKSAIAVKRQFGMMNGRRGAGKLVRTACYKIQMCRKIASE